MAEVPKNNSLLRAALEALAQGNYAESVRCCKHALKQDRHNYDAFVVLGKTLFAGKQYDQADISYKRAVDINANGLRAWQGLVELHEAIGNHTKVVEACNSIVHICQSTSDLTHLAEYTRRLATAHAALSNHQKTLEAWQVLLESPSVSKALHLEALCGIVDAEAALMESHIEEDCNRRLSEDKSLDAASARYIAENEWASSEENLKMEEMLRDILKQMSNSEKHETLLLQLLVLRMRAHSSSKGQEWRQTCLQVLQLCLSALSWHATSVAITLLLAICEEDSVDELFNELGMVELAQGQVNRLLILGKKLVHTYPDQGLVTSILAFFMNQSPFCSVSLGHKRSLCENALRVNENSIVGWQVLAELRASEGSHSSAVECIRRGLQVVSRFRSIYGLTLQCAELRLQLVLGDSLLKSGSYNEASKVFKNIIEVAEAIQDLEACKVLTSAKEGQVKLFLAEGRVQEASTALVSLLSLDKGNSWALAEQGWLAYQKKDFEQAIILLEGAVKLRPANASYHYRLGLFYWTFNASSDCKEKALSHLLESARLDSSQSEVFRILGHYYKDLPGGSKRAVRCYQKAVLLNCEDEEAGEALCDLLDSGGQELLELTSCREASQRSPRSFWAFRRLGYIQVRRKEWSDAVRNLQHAVRGYPTCADVWEALGLAYQQLGMLTASLKAYGRVIAIHGDGPIYALLQSGNILLMLGLYRKAVSMFQAALEKAPEHPAGLYGLASAFLGQARECRSMGAIRWSASLLKEASSLASCSLDKYTKVGSFWKLLGDIEITYARNLPWELTSDTSDGDSWSVSKAAQENQQILATFGMSLKIWNEQRLQSAIKAKRAYQHALHLQPQKGNLYSDLCLCLHLIGTLDEDNQKLSNQSLSMEAVVCCGLALEGSNADLWTSLGVVAKHKGIRQHAFIQALHVDGNHALAWAELGQLYLKEGEQELAKDAFTHARSADPGLALTWAAMSSMHVLNRTDEIQEAFASILYATQLLPIADFQLGLAKIAAATHQLDSVQVYAAVEQAVLQAPHRPEVHNFKGLVCELRGNYPSAIAAFQISRAALDYGPVVLRPGLLNHKKHAASINLARALCKAGNALAAVEEYEMLAKSGNIEDSSALRGYATALWQVGKQKLAVSVAKVAVKKSIERPAASAAILLLAKFTFSLTGPAAALEELNLSAVDPHSEIALALGAFAIASAAGQCDILLQMMSRWAILFDHDKASNFISLVAASMQMRQGSHGNMDYRNAIHLFQKTLHMHPQSLLIRTKLMQMFLERSDGMEVALAARCCCSVNLSRTDKAGEMYQLCQMVGAAALACSVCGSIKAQFSFSSCKSHCHLSHASIQTLQRWLHLEPWNIMSHYQLVLCLMQQAREQKFPVSTCQMLQRMAGIILARMSSDDDTAGEIHNYMRLQLMLCASEAALHCGNHELAVQSATGASCLRLRKNLYVLPHIQLVRCHAVEGNSTLVDAEFHKIGNLGTLDFPTWLCVLDLNSSLRVEKELACSLKDLDLTSYEEMPNYQQIPKAILEWKKAVMYIHTGDLSLAEMAALNAATLWPESDGLHLLHGAICMELVKSGSGSINASYASRRLMKVVSGSVYQLPIAGLLLAQAQSGKAGTPGWERLLRAEWALWPREYKPAELYFQMGLLAKISKVTNLGALEVPDSFESPRAWFRRAVHINPSCARYWTMLHQMEANNPMELHN